MCWVAASYSKVRRATAASTGRVSGDMLWAETRVRLIYQQRRVDCRTCGIRTERVAFADPEAHIARRLPNHWLGLPVDVVVTRGRSTWRQLEQSRRADAPTGFDASRRRASERVLGDRRGTARSPDGGSRVCSGPADFRKYLPETCVSPSGAIRRPPSRPTFKRVDSGGQGVAET